MWILSINLLAKQREEDTNNGRSLTPNNIGIFIWKYNCLNIKAKKQKECRIWTHKIYDKNGDGGNDYQ